MTSSVNSPHLTQSSESQASGRRDSPDNWPDRTETFAGSGSSEDFGKKSVHFLPGEIVAQRFRIVRKLGEGGMGQVYEALDLELGQTVAIKTIRPELSTKRAVLEQFRGEVRLARQVSHPNVCRIHDIYRHSARPAGVKEPAIELLLLSMELVEGESLYQHLRRTGPLSPEAVQVIAAQILAGLLALHSSGIIHRDLSSSNVMLAGPTSSKRIVLTDFGLSCLVRQENHAETAHPTSGKGRNSDVRGTSGYIAPELLSRGPVSAAADVFSFGALLVEMLTGKVPLPPTETLASATPELSSIDDRWRPIIARCLVPDPRHRYRDGGELMAAMLAIGLPPPGRSTLLNRLLLAPLLITAMLLWGSEAPLSERSTRIAEADLHFVEATRFMRARRWDGAVAALQGALVFSPASVRFRLALVECRLGQVDFVAAERELQAASSLIPQDDEEYQLLARALEREVRQEWTSASRTWGLLVELRPDNKEYALRSATSLARLGHDQEALQVLASSRKNSEGDPRFDLVESDATYQGGDLRRSLAAAERACSTAMGSKSAPLEAEAKWRVARALCALGRIPAGRESAAAAENLFRLTSDDGGLANALLATGLCFTNEMHLDSARKASGRALAIARAHGDRLMVAEALTALSLASWHTQDYERVIKYGQLAAEELTAIELPGRGARLMQNIGAAYQMTGDVTAALESYHQALFLARESAYSGTRALILANLGGLYLELGELPRSLDFLREARALGKQLERPMLSALASINEGLLFLQMGRLTEAETDFSYALRTSLEEDLPTYACHAMAGLAELQRLTGFRARSERDAREAISRCREDRERVGEIGAELVYARAILDDNATRYDRDVLASLLQNATEVNEPRLLVSARLIEARHSLALGDLQTFDKVLQVLDETFARRSMPDLETERLILDSRRRLAARKLDLAAELADRAVRQAQVRGYKVLELEARSLQCRITVAQEPRSGGSCWQQIRHEAEDLSIAIPTR